MKKLEIFLKKHGWSLWLGFGSAHFCGLNVFMWKWYAFVIPLIILVNISMRYEIKEKLNDKDNSSNVKK